MRFYEFKKDGSTLAVRTINRYADEVGSDSMDYDMFKKSAELLDKQMLKSLAQHIENSDTAPREYVMKTIADHDPDTFKKMYGDQEGYLSVMKPQKDLTDGEIQEGADFMGYMKEKDPEGGIRWTYPDGFETHTPHRSNFAAREFLSKVGMDPDFENSGPIDINTFIGTLSQFSGTDKEVKMYHDEAVRIKKTHPEITHVAFI